MAANSEKPNPTPKPRRRWFRPRYSLTTLFVVVTVVAVLSAVYSWLPNELSRQQLLSIKPGMTEKQVRDLVGRPDRIIVNSDGETDWIYGAFLGDTVEFKDGRVVAAFPF